jgi:hypothetical protein
MFGDMVDTLPGDPRGAEGKGIWACEGEPSRWREESNSAGPTRDMAWLWLRCSWIEKSARREPCPPLYGLRFAQAGSNVPLCDKAINLRLWLTVALIYVLTRRYGFDEFAA